MIRRFLRLHKAWFAVGGALFLLALGLGFSLRAASDSRHRAEALLHDVSSLQLGKTTFEEAKDLAKLHGGFVPKRSTRCSADNCDFDFVMENTALHRLHLSRPTLFWVTLKVQDGHVWYVAAGLSSGVDSSTCTAYVNERIAKYAAQSDGPFNVSRERDWNGRPRKIRVWLTPEAQPSDRQHGYSFNLHCLDKLGGCKDARDLLPALWPEDPQGPR